MYPILQSGIKLADDDVDTLDSNHSPDNTVCPLTDFQVLTQENNVTLHSFYFRSMKAATSDFSDDEPDFTRGMNFLASTISMVTECKFATESCNLHGKTCRISMRTINQYNCSGGFGGNLGKTPDNGHERAQGWNMSFYQEDGQTKERMPAQAQSNPFSFYAAAAVNGINLEALSRITTLPEVQPGNGSIVDIVGGAVGLVLDCQATIYDLSFKIIKGKHRGLPNTQGFFERDGFNLPGSAAGRLWSITSTSGSNTCRPGPYKLCCQQYGHSLQPGRLGIGERCLHRGCQSDAASMADRTRSAYP